MIITFSSLKGGTGKTSLSVHLAHAIALAKKRVLLADADPQNSASDWAAARDDKPPFPVIGMARNTLHRDLPELMKDYDHGIVDTPPRVSALARSAILAADLVLIPVQPSSYDVWAAAETVGLIDEARGFKPEIKAAFVINRKVVNTAIGREIEDALADYSIPTLKTAIAQRIAFAEASSGYTVMEASPSSAASKEIKQLAKEVLKFMGIKSW
ncbi:MAG: AAA family ATPase [Leptolyngbya sp. SIO4C5]|nr:AAA family ATPase [Leptolyngbya sp. SIO4C5]